MFEEVLDEKSSFTYQCDVSTFTGLYQKHVSTTYTTEVGQPVRCELKMKEQKTKCDSHSFHTALISRGNIQMKVIVKVFSEIASKCGERLHIEELQALETLETHESVARILGSCSTSSMLYLHTSLIWELHPSVFILAPYCIIFEFLAETLHENLKALYQSNECLHLNDSDEKTQESLKKFSCDVANGLEYLARKNFTYPRLTCQNIFLDDYKHCKLHDFTLRELHVNDLPGMHEQDDMQIAHEFLSNGDNTAKRDVWNYGQLLLKIYTFGWSL
ncbi:Tyrosine-protein kinase receptor Tie-1 [Holothuria leucospilota]|uniref:Tyrosine-protein kinase receptor Tie-1 n=1 Tax=Holothuria leucospilota TaxID=206669 RepID=A0A9Q1BYZ4_HOLLE|nr:Tyrosine-protein kinase receptor Tie-1 [Holothuria leucospilota]